MLDAFPRENAETPSLVERWNTARTIADWQAEAVDDAIEFAHDEVGDETRDFAPRFREQIEVGAAAWRELREAEFDLGGILRRRELVPFVLVPQHVSRKHGEAEPLSLLTHLQQAHDAFVFGLPFAALALLRSVLEVVLRDHYFADGANLDEMIDNCRRLPARAPKHALHGLRRLANDILHLNKQQAKLPPSFEKELLYLLLVMRCLIEEAPAHRLGYR